MTLVTHFGQHSMRWYWPIMLLYKPNSPNYGRHSSTLPSSVAQCPSIFLSAEVPPRHFGTSAEMSGQFGTSAEMSWVRSVLGPKCLDTSCVDDLSQSITSVNTIAVFGFRIICSNIKPVFCTAYCSKKWLDKNDKRRSMQFSISAEVYARHFGTGAELSRHVSTSLTVPKCLGSEMS